MKTCVMKFGGTSVADPEKIRRAAARAVQARRRGWGVVVVASAPGDMTDELLSLGRRVSARPPARELDQLLATGEQVGIALLSMALAAQGAPAVSLTGAQAGVELSGPHGSARIARVRPERIKKELARGRVAVVAGFQGANAAGDTATLGRGGSDLTAVALAAALKAGVCEVFTDVKGVYTADPRLVPKARKIERIGFDEMLELCGAGAQVMQPRSLEFARRSGVCVHVRSAFHPEPGTRIGAPAGGETKGAVALSLMRAQGGLRLSAVGPGLGADSQAAALMKRVLAAQKISARRAAGSVLRVSFLVEPPGGLSALRALHRALDLGR